MKRIFLFLLLLFLLFACQKSLYPKPTSDFYVNDFADALMPYTEKELVAYNRYLYEVYGEIQIVYVTFSVRSIDEIGQYDKTELFRQWKIGKNDMGVLVLLFFQETKINDLSTETLVAYAFELGYRIEPYLSPSFLSQVSEKTLLNKDHADISDLMVMHLNFELLNHLYQTLYNETPIDYDMELFYQEMMDAPYIPKDSQSFFTLTALLLLLKQDWMGFILIGSFVLLGGGFGFLRFKGGGGSSGGAGIFKRRR